jgi:hypothetical protein
MRASTSRLSAAAFLAAAALAAGATPALAAPDHTATLSTTAPSFAWDNSAAGNGLLQSSILTQRVGCNPTVYYCETTLIQLTDPGELDATVSGTNQTTQDIDLHLYYSDAEGSYTKGDLIAESTSGTADEAVGAAGLSPGYYLLLVDYYTAVAGAYHGEATFTP